jgi:membrane-associated phospholipid phosphatase
MKFRYLIFFLIFSNYLFAQKQNDSCCISICNIINTSIDYFNFPKRFEKSDWLTIAGVASFTAFSTIFDKDIQNFSQKNSNRNSFLDKIFKIDDWYGTEKGIIGIVGVTYLSGLIFDSDKTKKDAIMIGEAALLSSAATHIFKRIIGRGRPYSTDDQNKFIGPDLFNSDNHSMPSGHTACVFAMSTVIAGLTDNNFIKVLSYLPAFGTAYARIYHNQHWFSDVVLGAGIGYFTGSFILNRQNNKDKVSISLLNDDTSIMLSLRILF